MKPNDVRGFVHKRIGRALSGFITGGPVGALGGALSPGGAPRQATAPAFSGATLSGAAVHVGHGHNVRDVGHAWLTPELAMAAVPGGGGPCPGLLSVRGPGGTCIDLGALPPGGRPAFTPQFAGSGGAVMGRFGAGLMPAQRTTTTSVCLRGMVLGKDDLCYNKRDIPNRDRMWPKGRAPLLTGGEMRAISTAAAAAGKLTRTKKRLEKIGLMKKARKPMTIAQAKKVLHHVS